LATVSGCSATANFNWCGTLSIVSTLTPGKLTFNVAPIMTGGITSVYRGFEYTVRCSNSVVITPTITSGTVFEKPQNSESDINVIPASDVRTNLFFFNEFTCSVPGCCNPITYKVSSTTSASGGPGLTEVTSGVSINQYLTPGPIYYPGEVVFSAPSSTLGSTTNYYIYATNANAVVST
jgi:hypothetical protein